MASLETRSFANSHRTVLCANGKITLKTVNKVVPWVESFWHAQKRFPTDSELLTQFNFGGGAFDATREADLLQQLKLTRQFRAALKDRGITFNPLDPSGSTEWGQLSPEQIAAIAVLTNFADTRPQGLKLNQLGVTPEQIQGWMVNPHFKSALTARADEQLNNIYPEAVTSLNRRIKGGNVAAIKFYFELTGRAQTPEIVNLKLAMQHLIEAVQKHVQDPAVLQAIARDFEAIESLSSTPSPQTSQRAVEPSNRLGA